MFSKVSLCLGSRYSPECGKISPKSHPQDRNVWSKSSPKWSKTQVDSRRQKERNKHSLLFRKCNCALGFCRTGKKTQTERKLYAFCGFIYKTFLSLIEIRQLMTEKMGEMPQDQLMMNLT